MLDLYIRIGIREGAKDEEKSVHGSLDRLCPAVGGERDAGGGDYPETGDYGTSFLLLEKRFAGMGAAELRRLRQLEDENRRLKRLVADLTLDKQMLFDVLLKKFGSPPGRGTR
jgi:putative transposase